MINIETLSKDKMEYIYKYEEVKRLHSSSNKMNFFSYFTAYYFELKYNLYLWMSNFRKEIWFDSFRN